MKKTSTTAGLAIGWLMEITIGCDKTRKNENI
jgi:hypothetical protein